MKKPGPLCTILYETPIRLEDGLICRAPSQPQSPVGYDEPRLIDQFSGNWDREFKEEGWFEEHYPNLLAEAQIKFTDIINDWVKNNWPQTEFKDQKQRIIVHGRNKYEGPDREKAIERGHWFDNRFERCGDIPQTFEESDKILGSFVIDIETPVTIIYSPRYQVHPKTFIEYPIVAFEWTAVMYVEDTLGLQKYDDVVKNFGARWLKIAPSKRVKRARWEIHGQGFLDDRSSRDFVDRICNTDLLQQHHLVERFQVGRIVRLCNADLSQRHKVRAGESLSKIAQEYYKDGSLWPIIYDANQAIIGMDPNKLTIGQELEIPNISRMTSAQITEAKRRLNQGNLPNNTIIDYSRR